MAKIYVGNLTYELEPRDLEDEFARVSDPSYSLSLCVCTAVAHCYHALCLCHEQFGKVEQCAVKRGFAFIHFQEARDAEVCGTYSVCMWLCLSITVGLIERFVCGRRQCRR